MTPEREAFYAHECDVCNIAQRCEVGEALYDACIDTDPDYSCDSCQALMIQGVYCHETGCPNARKSKEA